MFKLRRNLQHHFSWDLITPGKDFDWQTALKGGRVLGRMLLRVIPLAVGSYTPMWVTSVLTVTRRLRKIYRSQGATGLVKYTKVCSIITQQSAGGQRISDLSSIGPRVARTAGGLPRIINKTHRRAIRLGDTNVIRLYLTIFGIYRVIEMPGKVNLSSITSLCLYRQADFMSHVKYVPIFWRILANLVKLNPLGSNLKERLGYFDEASKRPTLRIDRILPITKSGPLSSHSVLSAFQDPLWLDLANHPRDDADSGKPASTNKNLLARLEVLKENPDGVGFVAGLWRGLRPSELSLKERLNKAWEKRRASNVGHIFFSVSVWMNSGLLPTLKEWTVIFDNKPIKDLFKMAYTNPWGKLSPWGWANPGNFSNLGKLAFLEEPAGKVRVVAIVDVLTQSILYPLHKWIFSILEKIPQDGTFDQRRPIELLNSLGFNDHWSYDLSSATDRLPLAIQQALLEEILGEKVARLWATLLVGRDYEFHPRTAEKYGLDIASVRYSAGQPMGAYSSWAMLALTHHFIIQMAAYRVFGTVAWFTKYAVLGDDVVISDAAVASEYFAIMTKELRVKIQETKSLVSNNGSFEFAKKTFIRGVEASPISLKGFAAGLRNLPVMEGILTALPGVFSHRLKDVARTLGFGYRALGRLQSALHHRGRLQGLIVFLTRPSGVLGTNWLRWLGQETWLIEGGQPTQESIDNIYAQMGEWAAKRLLALIKSRRDSFSRSSGSGGWIPTSQFPTRALFDLYVTLVLRPISKDLEDCLNETETLLLQWRKRTNVQVDEFNTFMADLEDILGKLDTYPSTPRVARRTEERAPVGSSVLKLWRLLRPLIRKE